MDRARRRTLLPLVMLGFTAVPWADAHAIGQEESVASGDQRARVDALLASLEDEPKFAIAVGVVQAGQLVYQRHFGFANFEHRAPVDSKARFSLASMSKQFTAFAALLLAKDGALSLDDDVRTYIPELPVYDESNPIRIRDLIHHTSGLRDHLTLIEWAGVRLNEDSISRNEMLRLVTRQRGLCFPPGTEYQYTNTSYFLLAIVVERVSGHPFRRFLAERVFEPLGMRMSLVRDNLHEVIPGRVQGAALTDDGRMVVMENTFPNIGYAGVLSTVEDLARWNHNFDEPRVGGAWVIEQMTTGARTTAGEAVNYGGGLFLREWRGLELHQHSGGEEGFRSQYWRFPDQGLSIIALCNGGRDVAELIDPIIQQIAEIYLDRALVAESDPAPEEREGKTAPSEQEAAESFVESVVEPIERTLEELTRYTGQYARYDVGDILAIRLHEGALQLGYYQPGRRDSALDTALMGQRGNAFATPDNNLIESVTFGSAPGDDISIATLRVHGQATPLVFQRFRPLSDEDKRAMEGEYYCDDLNATWRISIEGDILTIHLPDRADRMLFDEPFRYIGSGAFVSSQSGRPRVLLRRVSDGSGAPLTWKGYNRITLEFSKVECR